MEMRFLHSYFAVTTTDLFFNVIETKEKCEMRNEEKNLFKNSNNQRNEMNEMKSVKKSLILIFKILSLGFYKILPSTEMIFWVFIYLASVFFI